MNSQGLIEEYESAELAVAALRVAEKRASRFDKPHIRQALNEAINALAALAIQIIDIEIRELKHVGR